MVTAVTPGTNIPNLPTLRRRPKVLTIRSAHNKQAQYRPVVANVPWRKFNRQWLGDRRMEGEKVSHWFVLWRASLGDHGTEEGEGSWRWQEGDGYGDRRTGRRVWTTGGLG